MLLCFRFTKLFIYNSMKEDKKIIVLTIKNSIKKMDLLRVHVYEHSIRFDQRIENAIKKLPELNSDVQEMNDLWEKQKISEKQILPIILHLMGKYGNYLQDFYFKKEELDKDGCFRESGHEFAEEYSKYDPDDEKSFFYEYFKEQKKLKKISKKSFEKAIPNTSIGEEYVEKYLKKGAKFYYAIIKEVDLTSEWYFMLNEKDLMIMAFEIVTDLEKTA